jgi:quercetin dioxygenase-like cupin family protein
MAWLQNPATGELAQLTPDASGRRVEFDLWLQPRAAVARAHVHDRLTERFEVVEGEVGLRVGRDKRTARAGAGVVEVPPGMVHDWWNAGDGIARVRGEVVGTPADRFVGMLEVVFSLGVLGRVDRRGAPTPLWLAAVMREYRDVIRIAGLPGFALAALAPFAARAGRDPLAAELHGTTAACAIDAPDPRAWAAQRRALSSA